MPDFTTSMIAGDFPLAHQTVTIAVGQNLTRGAVVGRVTATGAYVLSASAAADGSQTPLGILADDCNATAAARTAPVYFTGEFAAHLLTFGAGHSAATVDAGFRVAGRPIFIKSLAAAG